MNRKKKIEPQRRFSSVLASFDDKSTVRELRDFLNSLSETQVDTLLLGDLDPFNAVAYPSAVQLERSDGKHICQIVAEDWDNVLQAVQLALPEDVKHNVRCLMEIVREAEKVLYPKDPSEYIPLLIDNLREEFNLTKPEDVLTDLAAVIVGIKKL